MEGEGEFSEQKVLRITVAERQKHKIQSTF